MACLQLLFAVVQIASPSVAQPTDSHARMLAALEQIRKQTDETNPWLGAAPARESREALEEAVGHGDPIQHVWRLHLELAEEELRLGNEQSAIDSFQAAHQLLPDLPDWVGSKERRESIFRLALAYFRFGETQNCARNHNADACILPIRGAGVHVDERGSKEAIRYFREYLAATQTSSPDFVKAVWLLNVAAMTLGKHPQALEPKYRLPLSAFGSAHSFPRFRNVAPSLGIDSFNLSGGLAVDDFDGDRDLDIFTTTFDASGDPRFFSNLGNGRFEDRSAQAGLKGLYGGLNVIHADYDNDGDVDLYVLRGAWLSTNGRHPNSLLRNDGKGRFSDVTFEAGLGKRHLPSQTAAWADYDNDGDLDLFVGNEHDPAVDAPSQLFRNRGDGKFENVAKAAGVALRAYVKGVTWGDYNQDRYPDLYVSFLGGPNRLYRNNRDGTFTDVAQSAGVEGPKQSFPVWFWDYDNDGHLDLFVSSYKGDRGGLSLVAASAIGFGGPWELAKLYRGDGKGGFRDVAADVGLTRLHLPMGSNFGDLDNDGYLDFYLGTGYPDYEAVMPNVLYHNRMGLSFEDVSLAAGFGHLQKGHAVAFADYDSDGDLDVFEQMGGAFPGDRFGDALFQNPGFDNHWVVLQLQGTRSNRSALGARIRVVARDGETTHSVYRHVTTGGSFGGNPLRQTIGLGAATSIERVEVYWPTTDQTQVFTDVVIDRRYRVIEGSSVLLPLK